QPAAMVAVRLAFELTKMRTGTTSDDGDLAATAAATVRQLHAHAEQLRRAVVEQLELERGGHGASALMRYRSQIVSASCQQSEPMPLLIDSASPRPRPHIQQLCRSPNKPLPVSSRLATSAVRLSWRRRRVSAAFLAAWLRHSCCRASAARTAARTTS